MPRKEERKTNSKDDSDGPYSDEVGLTAMQELLGGFPRLSQEGVKKIYRTLLLCLRVPLLSPRNILEYSFLSGGEDKKDSYPGDDNMRPPTSWGHNARCSGNLTVVTVSPLREFSLYSGTTPGSNSTSL
ncbi:hypothetical protein HAX54_017317, partial [Datura stramonium]|nr:hypothetical protein [Datura stramonium]